VHQILRHLISPPLADAMFSTNDRESISASSQLKQPESCGIPSSTGPVVVDEECIPSLARKLPWTKPGGGVAVCASGPASLTTETANAVSRVQLTKAGRLGRGIGIIALHTEVFAL